MKRLALILVLALAGCTGLKEARVGPGGALDAGTTAYILSNPQTYRELNPAIPSDPVTGTVALLGMKYLGAAALIEGGMEPERANRAVDVWAGWLPGVHNLVFFATQSHPAGLAIGGIVAWYMWNDE